MNSSEHTAKPQGMSFSDYICEYVRDAILKGELSPGDRLREKDLEKLLGVSRTPIREAMKSLVAQGIVTLESWKGAYIARLTRNQLIELYDLRMILENFAVRIVTRTASADDLNEIEIILLASESAPQDDHYQLSQLNIRFHRKICELTQNRFVMELLDPLHVHFALIRGNAYGRNGMWRQVLEEHRNIFDAIKNGDPETSSELLRDHIFRSGLARLRRWDTDKEKTGDA